MAELEDEEDPDGTVSQVTAFIETPEMFLWAVSAEHPPLMRHSLGCLCFQVNGQQTLRNLRLQFAEQISLLAAERHSSSMKETLLRGCEASASAL